MRILVTGGAGFIGSCFVRHMLKNHPEYKIINLDALTYCGNLENLDDVKDNPNYTFFKGNICDKMLVRELMSEVDCVVNFAAESHVDNSIKTRKYLLRPMFRVLLTSCKRLKNAELTDFYRFLQMRFTEL